MDGIRAKVDFILKHNLVLQKMYKGIMSNFFSFLGLFTPLNDHLILFNAHGRRYNDSPKAIFEWMIEDERFKNFEFVWALDEPDKYDIPGCRKVKMDTMAYFLTALKAKYWVSCVNIERGLHFKNKNTIYLNTWHGTPLKYIGNAVSGRSDFDFSDIDIFCASGNYEKEIYIRDFNVVEENILLSGLPRNDELYSTNKSQIERLKEELKLPPNKKIILYAPTWRESKDKGKSYSIKPPINFNEWKDKLQDDYVLLLRTHAYTNKILGVEFDDFIRDFSGYSDINHLLMVSDILISDYSATIFDFSILEKPIICFGYDYEEYSKERGLYINLEEELPGGVIKSQEKIIEKILTMDYESECILTAEFKNKYLNYGGNATMEAINRLMNF